MSADPQLQSAIRIAIAALVGLAVGLEREWSGHATGPDARFAGLRTFFLLGLLGGAAGLLAAASFTWIATAVALGGAALCVAAYATAVRREHATPHGTTEAAALVVIVLGVLAGIGDLGLAAGAGAIVVLLLSEKTRLHGVVSHLQAPELRAGLQFAVLAIVVLPLLPAGPYFGALAFKPRELWAIVLVLSGLSFAGFVARRIVGPSRGMGITGALGGVVSSTAVTFSFSRQSRSDASLAGPLARGVFAASTVLVPRVIIESAVFSPAVSLRLMRILAPMFVVGLALVALGWRRKEPAEHAPRVSADENPLGLWNAIRMAVAFQATMAVIALVSRSWGSTGLYATAALLGLTDVDALTISMSRPEAAVLADIAARAIALGIVVNTLFRTGVALVLGRPGYRRQAVGGLLGLAAGGAAGILHAL